MDFLGCELRYCFRFPKTILPSIDLLANAQLNIDAYCERLLGEKENLLEAEPFVRQIQTLKAAASSSGTPCLWKADFHFIYAYLCITDSEKIPSFLLSVK